METEKESTESSCLLLPDAPKGAGSQERAALSSGGRQSGSLRQAAIDELCSCLPLHPQSTSPPTDGITREGRGEIEKIRSENMVELRSQCVEVERGGKMEVGQRSEPKDQF